MASLVLKPGSMHLNPRCTPTVPTKIDNVPGMFII